MSGTVQVVSMKVSDDCKEKEMSWAYGASLTYFMPAVARTTSGDTDCILDDM